MDEHLTPLPDDAPCSSTQATVADSSKRPTQRRKKPSSTVSNQVNSRRYLELVKNTGNDVGGFLKYIFEHKLEPLDTLVNTVESVFKEMDVNMRNHVQKKVTGHHRKADLPQEAQARPEKCKVCFFCTNSSLRKACGMVQLWEKMGTADFQKFLSKWTKATKILPPVDRVSKLQGWHRCRINRK